ncbi:MAG: hypothetical protein P0S93_03815 [Candidatus Neptunochlamydia sp.]|nr:hypothetical protein [Candidatus Neptunochlamydia sp.]
MVEAGHERIDTAFGTDQSHVYSTEGKEVRDKLTTGMLPLPGGFSNIAKNRKPLSQAYIAAKNGGKNSGLIKEYAGKSTKEIQKNINSLERQILKHKDKIANPSKHYPDWNNFHPNRQSAHFLLD